MKIPIWGFRQNAMVPSATVRRLSEWGMCLVLASWLLIAAPPADAWPFRSDLNRGNDLYKKGNYPEAGQIYGNILARQAKDQKARFNLGDALYKEGRYQESQKIFESLTGKSVPEDLRKSAYYNMGNSFFKQEDYKSAIGAYEEALKIDPKDKDARFNLELAKKMLAMSRQEKQKDQEKDKPQNKEDEKNKKQPSGNKPDEKEKNKEQGKEQNEPKQTKPGRMSKEDALRILNALEDQEKHKDQKLKAGRGKGDVKDW